MEERALRAIQHQERKTDGSLWEGIDFQMTMITISFGGKLQGDRQRKSRTDKEEREVVDGVEEHNLHDLYLLNRGGFFAARWSTLVHRDYYYFDLVFSSLASRSSGLSIRP